MTQRPRLEWRDATPFLAIRTRARIAENGH